MCASTSEHILLHFGWRIVFVVKWWLTVGASLQHHFHTNRFSSNAMCRRCPALGSLWNFSSSLERPRFGFAVDDQFPFSDQIDCCVIRWSAFMHRHFMRSSGEQAHLWSSIEWLGFDGIMFFQELRVYSRQLNHWCWTSICQLGPSSLFISSISFGGFSNAFIAVGNQAGEIKIIRAQTGEVLMTLSGHSNCINSVAWNPVQPWLMMSGTLCSFSWLCSLEVSLLFIYLYISWWEWGAGYSHLVLWYISVACLNFL